MLDTVQASSSNVVSNFRIKPSRYTVLVPIKDEKYLAYNTVSQSFSVWDSDEFAVWNNLVTSASLEFSNEFRPFVQGGYVVNALTDEVQSVRNAYEKTRFDDHHMMFTIAPTLACNFACHYCFQGLDKPVTRMPPKVREATLEHIKGKMLGKRSFHVTWYGGEPLMDRQTIFDISEDLIDYCKNKGVKYSAYMISNGYHLTRDVAIKLKKDALISGVQVTIDGDELSHDSRRHLTSGRGTFRRIIDNIKAIAKERILSISIRINIDGENEKQANDLLDVLHEEGLGLKNGIAVYFAPVENVAEASGGCDNCFSKTDYAELEIKLQRRAFELGLTGLPKAPKYMGLCQAVRPNSYVVVPNGDLHKCWDTVMDSTKRVGSVFKKSFRKTDAGLEKLWSDWSPFDNEVCKGCKLLPTCSGACAFKFVHTDYASGEAGKLPCPSLKFNLAEQLFTRAVNGGFVSEDSWDPETSPTASKDGLITGERHSFRSIESAHQSLVDVAAQ